jgi:hypothetical protein
MYESIPQIAVIEDITIFTEIQCERASEILKRYIRFTLNLNLKQTLLDT